MITFDLFQLIAVAFAVCGLAAVLVEIAVKHPDSFSEMVSDVRRVRGALPRATKRDSASAPASDRSTSGKPRISA